MGFFCFGGVFFFFSCTAWLAGSQFPDQGLNPGHNVKARNPNHQATREFPITASISNTMSNEGCFKERSQSFLFLSNNSIVFYVL